MAGCAYLDSRTVSIGDIPSRTIFRSNIVASRSKTPLHTLASLAPLSLYLPPVDATSAHISISICISGIASEATPIAVQSG